MRSDVVVIGAGAAGLMAAWRAAARGLSVVLLEKNTKPGVKILMSGGTRCNITQHTDRRGIVEAFGRQGPFLHSALAALGPTELVAMFNQWGVATKVEETGKVFPVSDSAVDVQRAIVRQCVAAGVDLRLRCAATELRRVGDGFAIETNQGTFEAAELIVTTGGKSYPGCGTTGDAYRWLTAWGHTIVPAVPALVPLKIGNDWARSLAGLTMPDTQVEVAVAGSTSKTDVLAQRRGSLLFTHVGVSGPVVLDVSRVVSRSAAVAKAGLHSDRPAADDARRAAATLAPKLVLRCDFLPGESHEQTVEWLRAAAIKDGKRPIVGALSSRVPRRLAERALEDRGIPAERRGADLSKAECRSLVEFLRRLELPITGTLGFEKAEVTAGGVSLDEVDSRSMASKFVPGLFLAGEVLDLDGPIGGFNFQAAFSTGYLAGSKVRGESAT